MSFRHAEAVVLLPVAPEAEWLAECLESLASQTLQGWTLRVVLDGDCPVNRAAIESSNVWSACDLVVNVERRGLAHALNVGLSGLDGVIYVARMDADDVCEPTRLSEQLARMTDEPDLAVLGTAATVINADGSPIGVHDVPIGRTAVRRRLRWRNSLIHPSVMFRRQMVGSLGNYNEGAARCEDYELWLRMVGAGYAVDNIGDRLLRYRHHEGQVSRGPRREAAGLLRDARRSGAPNTRSRIVSDLRHLIWSGAQVVRERSSDV